MYRSEYLGTVHFKHYIVGFDILLSSAEQISNVQYKEKRIDKIWYSLGMVQYSTLAYNEEQ